MYWGVSPKDAVMVERSKCSATQIDTQQSLTENNNAVVSTESMYLLLTKK